MQQLQLLEKQKKKIQKQKQIIFMKQKINNNKNNIDCQLKFIATN